MTSELVLLANGAVMAGLRRARGGRLSLTYERAWRGDPLAFPLSLSLPLAAREHAHDGLRAVLQGLLPDNPWILQQWGRRFGVSANDAFALLSHVGEDCPGAVQYARPERLVRLLEPGPEEIEWLAEADVAERLRALQSDASAWRRADDVGQFSLAGAQPKTALVQRGGRWGIPAGRQPTTHVLKPPIAGLEGHAENEHYCLTLARELGLPSARSEVRTFEDQVAIVVERYDRRAGDGGPVRIHQEDFCQALGLPPSLKYESDGGPGVTELVTLLDEASSEARTDTAAFLDALALNWFLGGTDAHAKNHSLLIGDGGQVRLAPLYDVASILPYEDPRNARLQLAMGIGGERRLRFVAGRHWKRLAERLSRDPDQTLDRVRVLGHELRRRAPVVARREIGAGLSARALQPLAELVSERIESCLRWLEA